VIENEKPLKPFDSIEANKKKYYPSGLMGIVEGDVERKEYTSSIDEAFQIKIESFHKKYELTKEVLGVG
jgi:hypothetical protein